MTYIPLISKHKFDRNRRCVYCGMLDVHAGLLRSTFCGIFDKKIQEQYMITDYCTCGKIKNWNHFVCEECEKLGRRYDKEFKAYTTFPILIKREDNGKHEVIFDPKYIPQGIVFMVIETNVTIRR